ncbi:MAG: hypothetical protein ABII00_09775 [Elusimicrobiota bacterium]
MAAGALLLAAGSWAGCSKKDSEPPKASEPAKAPASETQVPVHLDPREAKPVLDRARQAAEDAEASQKALQDQLDQIE